MNFLIIGAGAREHAIAAALQRSPQKPMIYCCGNTVNPGIKAIAHRYWVGDITNPLAITKVAQAWKIDIAIIGPEAPLNSGVADALWNHNIPTIGPKKQMAQIETCKAFARDLMKKYNIPGLPQYQTFNEIKNIENYLAHLGEGNYVVKATGLMGGKGVKVAGDHLQSFNDALSFCNDMVALGQNIVLEEKLIGQEFSLMCFCDGKTLVPMPIVQDHKRAFNDDAGPNTGGMGSYSDVNFRLPFLSEQDVQKALHINESIITALKAEFNDNYIGILYGSFIATHDDVYVIEFNARFGDPECLNVLTILESDFAAICQHLINGSLSAEHVKFAPKATVCKYAVPEGYPENPVKNVAIDISAVKNKSKLYLSAVDIAEGKIIATGSRTAAYVGVADSLVAAEIIAEREIKGVAGPLFHREDIGTMQLIAKRIEQMRKLRQS